MFQTFWVLEEVIKGHVEPMGQMYEKHPFKNLLEIILLAFSYFFCDDHWEQILNED